MSETADYAYDGHVVINAPKFGDESMDVILAVNAPQSIVVKKIEHMIPINVSCVVDGKEKILTAYIDYSTNSVSLPYETIQSINRPEDFKRELVDYLVKGSEEYTRVHEEMHRHAFEPEHNHGAAACPDLSTR
jgi:adenine C2-methylase RlmN of 23S rRNA A2503 and tRNA A37